MFKSIYNSIFLTESLKSAKEFATKSNIPQEVFDKFNALDTTPTKKLIHQMLKWQVQHSIVNDISDIKKEISTFIKFSGGRIKDQIEKFKTYAEFKTFITPFLTLETKSQKKDALAGQYKKIFENDQMLVVIPFTHKASCVYGANTKWCTTAQMATHFNSYQQQGYSIYYVINKASKTDNSPTHKMAVVVDKTGKIVNYYNTQDVDDTVMIKKWLVDHGIPLTSFKKIFKNIGNDPDFLNSKKLKYKDVKELVLNLTTVAEMIQFTEAGLLDEVYPVLSSVIVRHIRMSKLPKLPSSVTSVTLKDNADVTDLNSINNSNIKLVIEVDAYNMNEFINCNNLDCVFLFVTYLDYFASHLASLKKLVNSKFKSIKIDTNAAYPFDIYTRLWLSKKIYGFVKNKSNISFTEKGVDSEKEPAKKKTTLKKKK